MNWRSKCRAAVHGCDPGVTLGAHSPPVGYYPSPGGFAGTGSQCLISARHASVSLGRRDHLRRQLVTLNCMCVCYLNGNL